MITSPYGENSIFIKDIKSLAGAYEDSLQPTNPSTQKAILEGGNQQFKISPKVTGSDVGAANPLQEISSFPLERKVSPRSKLEKCH